MMAHKKLALPMKLINLLRKSKLNPRLEVMRYAIYGIALGAAYLVFKPEIQALTDEASCRWSATTTEVQSNACLHAPAIPKEMPSAPRHTKGALSQ